MISDQPLDIGVVVGVFLGDFQLSQICYDILYILCIIIYIYIYIHTSIHPYIHTSIHLYIYILLHTDIDKESVDEGVPLQIQLASTLAVLFDPHDLYIQGSKGNDLTPKIRSPGLLRRPWGSSSFAASGIPSCFSSTVATSWVEQC